MATAAPSALVNGLYGSKSFDNGLVKLSPSKCSPSNYTWQRKDKLYGPIGCKQRVSVCAEYNGGSRRGSGIADFLGGVLVGGAVFGTLSYLFAPQIKRSLLTVEEDWFMRRRLPNNTLYDYNDKDLEITRKTLNDKIAQLNSAIDEVSEQLKSANTGNNAAHGASEIKQAA